MILSEIFRLQDGITSFIKYLEAVASGAGGASGLGSIITRWNALYPSNALTTLNITPTPTKPSPDVPGIHLVILSEDDSVEENMRQMSLVQMHVFVKKNTFLSRFIRSIIFSELGFRNDRAESQGYIPLLGYVQSPNSPKEYDKLIVERFKGEGWVESKPGDDTRIIDDPTVVHHVANIVLQY